MTAVFEVSRSHSFTVRSSEQDSMTRWSGETWHYLTQLVWPRYDCLNLPERLNILRDLSELQDSRNED